jgi:predicted transcriptional regulator
MTWQALDFETAARLGTYLAKDYAQAMFDLLVNYHDISASEAASRLNLHIRTAQDFLDAVAGLGIVRKTEVHEGKRPYLRYTLNAQRLRFELDLAQAARTETRDALARRIRERPDANANFVTARDDNAISSVTFWAANGRDRKERRISLTGPQGRFLYHLPFPDAEPQAIAEIMREASLAPDLAPEILDIVDVLTEAAVVDVI